MTITFNYRQDLERSNNKLRMIIYYYFKPHNYICKPLTFSKHFNTTTMVNTDHMNKHIRKLPPLFTSNLKPPLSSAISKQRKQDRLVLYDTTSLFVCSTYHQKLMQLLSSMGLKKTLPDLCGNVSHSTRSMRNENRVGFRRCTNLLHCIKVLSHQNHVHHIL